MRPQGTRVPAIVGGVCTRVEAALKPLQIIAGPRAAQNLEPDVLFIGIDPAGSEAVSVDSRPAPGLGGRPVETVSIWCLVSVFHGDADVQGLYDRAGRILDDLEGVLSANGTIPDVVDDLGLAPDYTWTPAQYQNGVALEVSFQITGRCLR